MLKVGIEITLRTSYTDLGIARQRKIMYFKIILLFTIWMKNEMTVL